MKKPVGITGQTEPEFPSAPNRKFTIDEVKLIRDALMDYSVIPAVIGQIMDVALSHSRVPELTGRQAIDLINTRLRGVPNRNVLGEEMDIN